MRYIKVFKYLCRCTAVLAGAIVLRAFLDIVVILQLHLGTLLVNLLGDAGVILMIFIEMMGISLLSSAAIIGILGGLWIGGKATNGFILSFVFYLSEFIIQINTLGLRYDLMTFLAFFCMLVGPVFVTVVYAYFSKLRRARLRTVTF